MNDHSQLAAMTVNERLSQFGLFDEFYSAVEARELQSVVAVLIRAQLTPVQALDTATAVLNNPTKYRLR